MYNNSNFYGSVQGVGRAEVDGINTQLDDITNEWQLWTPTLTWGTAIPIEVVVKAKFRKIGKTVFIAIKIDGTDGNSANALQVSLPFYPNNTDMLIYIPTIRRIGAGESANYATIGASGVIAANTGTMTAGSSFTFRLSGTYESEA